MPAQIITASELASLQLSQPLLTLLDVRLPEDHALSHLPNSVNQCVFEVAFLNGLEEKSLARDTPICVYGADDKSYESRVAAGKLERAGYLHIYDFRGGLAAWESSGHPVEASSGTPAKSPQPMDCRIALDIKESTVTWFGRNLLNKHSGTVALKSGWVEFRNGKPTAGEVLLDLRRLTCIDLAGSDLHDMLIHHLESDDFLDIERFPEACFTFDQVDLCSEQPGCKNLQLDGALTLRGVTKPLIIDATAGFTPEGKAALQSTLTIDRTDWGLLYGSGKFFRKLAGHLVNDHIELQLRIITSEPVMIS